MLQQYAWILLVKIFLQLKSILAHYLGPEKHLTCYMLKKLRKLWKIWKYQCKYMMYLWHTETKPPYKLQCNQWIK